MRAPAYPTPVAYKSQRGFTLVELMISLVLGLLLTAVIGYAYLGSRQVFRTTDTISRMQESARYVFEKIAYDIRLLGFSGCLSVPPGSSASASPALNVLASPTTWYTNLFGQPIIGYQNTAPPDVCTTANTSACYLHGDALTLLRADNSQEYVVAAHDNISSPHTITTTASHNFSDNEILVVADCANAAVFQASTASGTTVTYTGDLGTTFPASLSRIMPLSAMTYYIGRNSAGEPAVYRENLKSSGATLAEEVVEGVQDMHILYGVDTAGTDKTVDAYVTASAVADWSKVLSVRISLLMVSRSDESITSGNQPYVFPPDMDTDPGTTAPSPTIPSDRLLRRVFTTTITVRNRL